LEGFAGSKTLFQNSFPRTLKAQRPSVGLLVAYKFLIPFSAVSKRFIQQQGTIYPSNYINIYIGRSGHRHPCLPIGWELVVKVMETVSAIV